jgi:hypothetical protein
MMFRPGPLWVRNAPNGFGCRLAKMPTSTWAGSCHKRSVSASNRVEPAPVSYVMHTIWKTLYELKK